MQSQAVLVLLLVATRAAYRSLTVSARALEKETVMDRTMSTTDEVRKRFTQYNNLWGRKVVGAAGIKLGTFDQVVWSTFKKEPYLLVRTGPLGAMYHADALYIPAKYVERITDEEIRLKITKDELGELNPWSTPEGVDRW
jgi:hypothetical protein